MATQKLRLTTTPMDLHAALSLNTGWYYVLHNVGGRRVLISVATGTDAPDILSAPARQLAPSHETVQPPVRTNEKCWVWAEGPAGATLIVDPASGPGRR